MAECMEARRVKTLTDKALTHYNTKRDYYLSDINKVCTSLKETLSEFDSSDKQDVTSVTHYVERIKSLRNTYELKAYEFLGYLKKMCTKDSLDLHVEFKDNMCSLNDVIDRSLRSVGVNLERPPKGTVPTEKQIVTDVTQVSKDKVPSDIQFPAATKSIASSRSSSKYTQSSSRVSQKRAKAEAARATLEIARKEADLRKRMAAMEEEKRLAMIKKDRIQAEYNAELTLLGEEKIAAAAEAEATYLEAGSLGSVISSLEHSNAEKRTREYVNSLPAEHEHSKYNEHISQPEMCFVPKIPMVSTEAQHSALSPTALPYVPISLDQTKTNIEPFTSFLLKRDLLPKRLYKFNDEPHSFEVWRASFSSVVEELKMNAFDQVDLLVRHLGKESTMCAESLRNANAKKPERALRLIWERLEERYGRPEMIESSLKNKLEKFPVVSNKDNKKLYQLGDLLDQILSAKEDPRYATQFAVFDSSRGMNSILEKLPYGIQQKWVSHASKYKKRTQMCFPPFSEFVEFFHDVCRVLNDPAFNFEPPPYRKPGRTTTGAQREQVFVSSHKTDLQDSRTQANKGNRCPIHNANHTLTQCKDFISKTLEQRRSFLRAKGICFRCLSSTEHMFYKCPVEVSCDKCGRKNHVTLMHREETLKSHGGEGKTDHVVPAMDKDSASQPIENVSNKCTAVQGKTFKGRSCGKTILVDISSTDQPMKRIRVYALLDDQSNRSLISPELCDMLSVTGDALEYTLSSCSGRMTMYGKRVSGLSVQSITTTESFELPELIECEFIPQDLGEVPTPDVASSYSHLEEISSLLHPLDETCGIHILIGRDAPQLHHVKRQIVGEKHQPFAQELPLGWVVIGQICLGKFHQPDEVHAFKTNIVGNGRETIMDVCRNTCNISERTDINLHKDIFYKSPDDENIGLSADDRLFVKIMDSNLSQDSSGQWIAPLPFKEQREVLPDNRALAYKRAKILDRSLQQNPTKRTHMVEFMDKVFKSGAAEVALETDKEKWYLPLFGVYHPRKPGQIRGVFDSSVLYEGKSLNDMLLCGPNLTNSLIGVLLRFRSNKFAVSADIEQMFYRFLVTQDHRRFLRFFWYKDNNPDLPLVEYQMRVHVFGNRPSPAVATYALRKIVETADDDVKEHVYRNFYVDDALFSLPSREEAISLLSRIRGKLEEGCVNLHKIASNDIKIMDHFPKEALSKEIKNLNLDIDDLPQQLNLGLVWDLHTDTFKFSAPENERPFTRRGMLSAMNSVFDPLGFLAPFAVSGKMMLREVCPDGTNWDDAIPEQYLGQWNTWNEALHQLDGYRVPRMFVTDSLGLLDPQVYVYTDASEKGIAAVAYLVADTRMGKEIGFIMGKAKVAPKSGHSIPRLELCGAVIGIELAHTISEHLDIPSNAFRYFVDSKVVLGYIHNKARRFYTYVSNRVARIHDFSKPDQWSFVQGHLNPADSATRSSLQDVKSALARWHSGPTYIFEENFDFSEEVFDLCEPECDSEIRPEVVTKATYVDRTEFCPFDRFSSWKRILATYAILIHVARTFKKTESCNVSSWHVCRESTAPETLKAAENHIVSVVQKQFYAKEILALKTGKPITKNSSILSLSPYLDENELLRVGGRLNQLRNKVGIASVNPVIIPKCHIASLLTHHFHERVFHQGRHFTEGSLRSNGFWIVGAKRLVSSVLKHCTICRKLRGQFMTQKMADIPEERLSPGPPFTAVGVDVFGPWEVVTRKTRGGVANSKRWAVMFTCMTSRASHIEVIEDMSASCFINALSRLIAIRGPVKTLYSDRGTNFVGAASLIGAHVIHVEDENFQEQLKDKGIIWRFNSPHSSHMGGVWERPIGIARRILDSMFMNCSYKELTHEVLATFMYEIAAIMNSRPLVAIDTDSRDPIVLSPSVLLTQKQGDSSLLATNLSLREMYTAQWKKVQYLSDVFWKHWRSQYLQSLQVRKKWQTEQRDPQVNELVLMRDDSVPRYAWPTAVISKLLPSNDGKIRKCEVRVGNRDGNPTVYTRPITDLIRLCAY